MGTRRKLGKKIASRHKITRGLLNGSRVKVADNSVGILAAVAIPKYMDTRLNRIPAAAIGNIVSCTVKKGKPELRGQIMKAIIIRQKKIYKRVDGTRLCFEDNAAVLISKEGDPKGTEIRGPIAREAAELYPRLASIASLIV